MSSDASLGWGTLFQTESLDSPGLWLTVAEVFNISPPTLSRGVIDTSTGNAPNEWQTCIPGMPNANEVSIQFNFVPGASDYSSLKLELDDQTIRRRKIVFPDASEMEFSAFLTELSAEIPVDSQMKATAKFQVVGEVDAIS